MQQESVYDVLCVADNASLNDITMAYRREAMKWRTGHGTGRGESSSDMFRRVSSAFKTLSDPAARLAYDRKMKEAALVAHGGDDDMPAMPQPPLLSLDEAAALFSGQLLKQAAELARHGFNELAIARVLTGLGCSETEAVSAAASAVGGLQVDDNASLAPVGDHQPIRGRADSGPFDIDTASWERAKPYYEAVIVGTAPWREYTEEEADAVSRKRAKLFVIAAIVGFVVGMVMSMQTPDPRGVMVGAMLGPAVAIILAFCAERWIIRDIAAYVTDKNRKYYLDLFERFHTKSPGSKFSLACYLSGMFWFSYRRMPGYAALWTALSILYTLALAMAGMNDNPLFNFLFWIAIGLSSMPCYFRHAKAIIRKAMRRQADQALDRVREAGGVNRWSWSIQFAACFIIYVALAMSLDILVM